MARKLLLPAGTYPCQWICNGYSYDGDLRLEEEQAPGGEIFDDPGTLIGADPTKSSPHSEFVPVLNGRTRAGHIVLLLDAEVRHRVPGLRSRWSSRSQVRAAMALVGPHLPDQATFSTVEFQVGGLTDLAGVHPFAEMNLPTRLVDDATFSATWNKETRQTWTAANGDELRLDFNAHPSHRGLFGFSISTAPLLVASGVPRSAEDWMRQYVRPLAEVCTFATLKAQPVSWVTLHHEDLDVRAQLFASDITQQPYDAEPTESSKPLIQLGPDGVALPDLLAGWRSLQTTYTTFFDYLTVAMRESMNVRSRFLALVPALESFHVAEYGDGPVPRSEFKKERKRVLKRISELAEIDDADVEFLKTWLSPLGSYQLAERLRELVAKELSEGLQQRVRARIEPLPHTLQGMVQSPADVWAVMGTARNRIAHGADNQPSPEQLLTLTRLAHTVAVGTTLRRLGVPDTVLCAAIDDNRWRLI
ncbi:HEPN domain-containing protein [Saccharopolyspora sp. 5N102]|uniref:ApeA N-terminal domain 1-containing protein n=1 Tax=Saccharopolyspora sp. 5N102 TaxID=3375155 RepID=UPI0037A4E50C